MKGWKRLIDAGKRQADAAVASRAAIDKARAAKLMARATAGVAASAAADGGSNLLVAEGDSWFDYPFSDVLKELENQHGFEVEAVSHWGDRIEGMAYDEGQLDELTRRLSKVIARQLAVRAVLLSGGGNDIAGDDFGMLLNHAKSPDAGLNRRVVDGVLEDRVRPAYITILSAVTRVCEQMGIGKVPIVVHGYDYPVPDGRGMLGGWGPLPGPWLAPGFQKKCYEDMATRLALMVDLIDRFNGVLAGIAGKGPFGHVRFVDLRGTLSNKADYKKSWGNEFHPTKDGFRRVADRFAAVL